MQSLLLFKPDYSPFDPKMVERAFRSIPDFTNPRFEEPGGALIECEYKEPDSGTLIRLSGDASTITVDYTWSAAHRAALSIQKALAIPLRVCDSSYTFDLNFSDISSVEELETAMENARTN